MHSRTAVIRQSKGPFKLILINLVNIDASLNQCHSAQETRSE